jgi:hypothetical protein
MRSARCGPRCSSAVATMFWRSRPTVGRGRLFTAVTQQFARSGKRSNAEQIDRSGHDRREARRATIMRNTSLAALYGFPGVAAVTDAPVVRPGRTIAARVGSKVYGKHATHDIFVDFDAKKRDCFAEQCGHNRTLDCGASSRRWPRRVVWKGLSVRAFASDGKRRTADGIFDGPAPCGI